MRNQLFLLAAAVSLFSLVDDARAQVCFNYLDRQTYAGGFKAGDFASITDLQITAGKLVLANGKTTGEAISTMISTEIPVNLVATTNINALRVTWDGFFNSGCGNWVDLFYSLDDGTTWKQIAPLDNWANPKPAINVDLKAAGVSGAKLRWKVKITQNSPWCNETNLTKMWVGYAAQRAGEYTKSEPIPQAYALYRATYEEAQASWPEPIARGHVKLTQLYHPETLADTRSDMWDAGAVLANRSDATRKLLYNDAGTARGFLASDSALRAKVLPAAVRGAQMNGKFVYDFNGDNLVDDNDAQWLIDWTRGKNRAWKLGAIYGQTPAFVGPPGYPWWIDGSATPAAEKTAFLQYRAAQSKRPTRILAASTDGMLHAFNGGAFRWGDDPTTTFVENRGYFEKSGGTRDMGDGSEVWAWLPGNMLSLYKNNVPKVWSYNPTSNPLASIDGAVTVADIIYKGAPKTIAVVTEGNGGRGVIALDVTDADNPVSLWPSEWTDSTFVGSYSGAAVGPAELPTGRRWIAAVASSALTSGTPTTLNLYLINLETGATYNEPIYDGKIQMFTSAYRASQPPVLVDANGNGMADRVYLAANNGIVYKKNLTKDSGFSCGAVNSPPVPREFVISAGLSAQVVSTSPPKVNVYLGTSDNPDISDTANQNTDNYLIAYQDTDINGACDPQNNFKVLWKYKLPAGEKVFTAPVVSGDTVYFATSTGDVDSVCGGGGNSTLYALKNAGDGNGNPVLVAAPVTLAAGAAVAGVRVHDNRVLVNTAGGSTTMLGAANTKWNNDVPGAQMMTNAADPNSPLPTTVWYEE